MGTKLRRDQLSSRTQRTEFTLYLSLLLSNVIRNVRLLPRPFRQLECLVRQQSFWPSWFLYITKWNKVAEIFTNLALLLNKVHVLLPNGWALSCDVTKFRDAPNEQSSRCVFCYYYRPLCAMLNCSHAHFVSLSAWLGSKVLTKPTFVHNQMK